MTLTPALAADAGRLGRAFGGYLRDVAATAQQRQTPAVFFLSGEGRWFAAAYERIRAATPGGRDLPAARHLPISRQASFLASLDHFDAAALAPMLAQYTAASLGAVLGSLGLGFHTAELAALGLDAARPWAEQAKRAYGCAPLVQRIEARRQAQRALLLAYLQQQGFPMHGDALVADIGWRGSIQDNLGRLLPGTRLHGCYFLLLAPFVAALPHCTRQSFLLPDAATARRLRFGAPLELAVGGEGGTVIGYEGNADLVLPVEASPPRMSPAIVAFRAALTKAAQHSAVTPRQALADTLRFLEHPSREFASLYFGCERDERFGTGQVLASPAALTARDLLTALSSRAARHRLGLALARSGWPWALLRRDLAWLLPLLRPALLRLDLRLPGAPRSLDPTSQGGAILQHGDQAG